MIETADYGSLTGLMYFVLGRESALRSGSGPIQDIVDVPVGATLTYRITGFAAEDADGILGHISASPVDTQLQLNPNSNRTDVELGVGFVSDLDGDGTVSFSDFLILSANFGKTTTDRGDGDLDGNGLIDLSDFLRLVAEFGRSS